MTSELLLKLRYTKMRVQVFDKYKYYVKHVSRFFTNGLDNENSLSIQFDYVVVNFESQCEMF